MTDTHREADTYTETDGQMGKQTKKKRNKKIDRLAKIDHHRKRITFPMMKPLI